MRRIIKITVPTNPLPLFNRTIAGSLARAVDADIADVLSFRSCEKFETHLAHFSPLFLLSAFSLSLSPFFPRLPFIRDSLGVAVVRIQATTYGGYVRLIGSRARTSLFFFKLHDDRVFLFRVFTYVNRRSWATSDNHFPRVTEL